MKQGLLLLLAGFAVLVGAQSPSSESQPKPAQSELDEFMAKVLQRRDIDWEQLHNYVFSERESLELKGAFVPIENIRREYIWRVRDGYLVRTPVKANGVKVSAEEQAQEERKWVESQKRGKNDRLQRESFFGFKFQPGRYLYAGKKTVANRELMVIEYYPDLSDEDEQTENQAEKKPREARRDRDEEEYYERMFEKSIVVNMLVLPEEHQLVEMTFDNVSFDFLPAKWLVRVADVRASLTMDKPYGDVWLPKSISAWGAVTTAYGDLSVRFSREFYDYRKTDVKVKFWYEKRPPAK